MATKPKSRWFGWTDSTSRWSISSTRFFSKPTAKIGSRPGGFSGAPYRSSDSAVFVVVEGNGRTVVSGEALAWRQHDVFVVPSWREYHHEAADESLLFSFSDRPVQEKLGLWRERRGGN